jgi:hypothetical protein
MYIMQGANDKSLLSLFKDKKPKFATKAASKNCLTIYGDAVTPVTILALDVC